MNKITTELYKTTVAPPPQRATITMKADSGASRHYIRPQDSSILQQKKHDPFGPTVQLPNSESITATETGQLPLSNTLSTEAKKAHVLDELLSASLLSLGQICDDNCNIVLTKEKLIIYKDNNIIATGTRNKTDGLWDIPLTKNDADLRHKLNIIIIKNKTKQQLANYLHGCCFAPKSSTFIRAIKNGNFISWPGLDSTIIDKHLVPSIATAKGHLDQERKNLQSTKTPMTPAPSDNDDTDDFFPTPTVDNEKTHDVCAIITPFDPKSTAYSDLTGRFPHKSSRGNEYLLVVYDFDSNAILVEAIKNRTAKEITKAWEKIHLVLKSTGAAPNLYILDNEISGEFKTALGKYKLAFQRTPPHIHRRNAAERAIRTFKKSFF